MTIEENYTIEIEDNFFSNDFDEADAMTFEEENHFDNNDSNIMFE